MSESLAVSSAEPVAVVGDPWTWAVHSAALAVLAPVAGIVPFTLWLGLGLHALWITAELLVFVAAAAGLCGLAGLGLGAWLERLRGWVPLPILALLAGLSAGACGTVAAGLTMLLTGAHPSIVPWAAATLGVTAGVLWLPYTMARVLRKPTWPLVLGAVAVAPIVQWVMVALLRF